MVIERFPLGIELVGARFRALGRQMPDNVQYVASWLSPGGEACFQLMEAPSREAMQPWVDAWADLVEFEICPVVTSAEFWARRPQAAPSE